MTNDGDRRVFYRPDQGHGCGTQTTCRAEVDEKLMRLSVKVDSGFEEIEKRVARNEERIAYHVETRVPTLETRLAILEQTVASINTNVSEFRKDINSNVHDFRVYIDDLLTNLSAKLDNHIENDTTKLSRLFISTWAQFLGVIAALVLMYLSGFIR
jgi:uncharacterized coiled-coil protein SlyX